MASKSDVSKGKLTERLRAASTAGPQAGFSEAPAAFAPAGDVSVSRDTRRFQESVRLARTFAAIESPVDRHLLIEFAERLAAKPG